MLFVEKNRQNLTCSSFCSTESSSLRSVSPSLRYSHRDCVTRIIKTSLSLLQTLLGVILSVCLQPSDQVGARAKGFELLTHRCRSSIYEVAVV